MRQWIIALVLCAVLASPFLGAGAASAGSSNQGQKERPPAATATSAAQPPSPTPSRNRTSKPVATVVAATATVAPPRATTVPPTATKPAATAVPPTVTMVPATATTVPPTMTPTMTQTVPTAGSAKIQLARLALVTTEKIEAAVTGFTRREQLSIWLTDPADRAIPANEETADNEGSSTFRVPLPDGARAGKWAITVRGQTSQRQVIATFTVANVVVAPTSAAKPGTTTPPAQSGEVATVTPTVTPTATPQATATHTPTATPTATPTPTPTATPRGRPNMAHLMPPAAPGGPLPVRLRQTYFGNAAKVTGVPIEILLAIAAIESGFSPGAVGPYLPQFAGTENENALGMMQFLPGTYRPYARVIDRITGKNLGMHGLWDPESAVYAAGFYLRDNGAPSNMRRALFAYNNAEWYVDLVLAWADYYAKGGGIGTAPAIDREAVLRMRDPATSRATETKPGETKPGEATPTAEQPGGTLVVQSMADRAVEREINAELLAYWIWLEEVQGTWQSMLTQHRPTGQ